MELKTIIQHCHDRKNRTLNQRKTIVLPGGYDEYPYHFRVYHAHEKSVILYKLEKANISFMPIEQEPFDRAPADWARSDDYYNRIKDRQDTGSWRPRRWYASWGIGIYTGETSGYEDAIWHDIEFTYQAILRVPDAVSACLEALISAVVNPLVTLAKDGGLRFSCRIEEYLHPNTPEAKQYIYERRPTRSDPKHRDVYVEVKGDMDYSVWDARYEILVGSLLEPPVISSDVLFGLLGFFRSALHKPVLGSGVMHREPDIQEFEREKLYKPLRIEDTEISVPEKMQAIREGNLSPLAIKRPGPVLTKQVHSEPEFFDIADILETDARVIGIETGLRHPEKNREIERAFLEKEPLLLSMPTIEYCKKADQYWTVEGFSIGAMWQPNHLEYVIKDVPLDELLKHPFARGNLCIDSKRYKALYLKGGNSNHIICPKCPVHEECLESGFHSQRKKVSGADVCITEYKIRQVLTDPLWDYSGDYFFDDRDRVCIVSDMYASDLFVAYGLSVKWLEEWIQYWECSVLGDFAHAMLNAIRIYKQDLTDNIVKRIRAVVKAFEGAEETLIEQMCQVNVAVEDADACIGMSMKDAVAFGILNIDTVKNIEKIQKILSNPNWTYFHQLKRFFEHYRRDVDAPMWYEENQLRYWIPPVLHPRIKKLVILSPSLCEEHLRKVFPNEPFEIYNFGTKETLAGNRVYQLRSEVHSPHSLLNYDLDWDALGLSSIGTRFTIGAHHEIERASDTQHTLIFPVDMNEVLEDTLKIGNTKSMYFYKDIPKHAKVLRAEFEGADVIWVFGTPYWPPKLIWKYAKILFGDETEPLDYSVSMNPYVFKDERLQKISDQYALHALIGILTYSGLKDSGKTIVLNTALRVPGITDALETMLFDWEDFEITGGLDKLPETIARREAFEAEAAKIDETWLPYPMMQVLGIDRNEANRILREEHGRKGSVTIREEILALIKGGKTKLKDIVDAIPDRHLSAVQNEVKRMQNEGIIVRTRWGIYRLSKDEQVK